MRNGIIRSAKKILPYQMIKNIHNKDFIRDVTIPPPIIYNSFGEKMEVFYLQDNLCRTQPYGFITQTYPRHILWDRYNQALDVQFYTHDNILDLSVFIPKKRFAYFIESEALTPKSYELLYNNQALAKEFNAIFTTSDRHLNELPNAKFLPAGGVWYGGHIAGGKIDVNLWQEKTKNISMVSSAKVQCDLHKYRLELVRWCANKEIVDTYGNFNGGEGIGIGKSLEKYRYSIVIENNISDYYFTEKILNCFASMTIPIYIGARKIKDFFNEDGIIRINPEMDIIDIEKILKSCTKEAYEEKVNIIKENFEKVNKFMVVEDYLFENYKDILI